MLYFSISLTVLSTLVLLWIFYRANLLRKPKHVVLITFGLGMLTALPVESLLRPFTQFVFNAEELSNVYLASLGVAFVNTALLEEMLKFLGLVVYAARHRTFDGPMDGVVYGVAVSMGFAACENVGYVLVRGELAAAVMRLFVAVPIHAFAGAIMGYYLGRAKCGEKSARARSVFLALFWPILLHGAYDFPLCIWSFVRKQEPDPPITMLFWGLLPMAVFGIGLICVCRLVNRMRQEQLARRVTMAPAATDQTMTAGTGLSLVRHHLSAWRLFLMIIGGLLALPAYFFTVTLPSVLFLDIPGLKEHLGKLMVMIVGGLAAFALGAALLLIGWRYRRNRKTPGEAAVPGAPEK